jgi:hypothetical protein
VPAGLVLPVGPHAARSRNPRQRHMFAA